MAEMRRAQHSGAIRLRWLLLQIGNGLVVAELDVEPLFGQKARIVSLQSGADFRNPLVPVAAVATVVVGKT